MANSPGETLIVFVRDSPALGRESYPQDGQDRAAIPCFFNIARNYD